MKVLTLIIFIIPIVLTFITDTKLLFGEHLLEFGDNNILEKLERSKYSLIYFYSDECKFCYHFEPEFEYLSILYNNITNINYDSNNHNTKNFQVIRTNARKNVISRELFKVEQYPTIILLCYDIKGAIKYKKDRSLKNLINFIQENVPNVSPNYENFHSNVIEFDEKLFNKYMKSLKQDILIVFTLPYIDDWKYYFYPTHFYQKLALSNPNEKFKYAIIDGSKTNIGNIPETYGISNYPSIMYFSIDGKLKIYQIESKDDSHNNSLNEDDIKSFIINLNNSNKKYGKWFKNLEELKFNNLNDNENKNKNFKKDEFRKTYLDVDLFEFDNEYNLLELFGPGEEIYDLDEEYQSLLEKTEL